MGYSSRPRQEESQLGELHKDAEDEPSGHRANGNAKEDAEDGGQPHEQLFHVDIPRLGRVNAFKEPGRGTWVL